MIFFVYYLKGEENFHTSVYARCTQTMWYSNNIYRNDDDQESCSKKKITLQSFCSLHFSIAKKMLELLRKIYMYVLPPFSGKKTGPSLSAI